MKQVISNILQKSVEYKSLIKSVDEGYNPIYITGTDLNSSALLTDTYANNVSGFVMYITPTEHEAKRVFNDLLLVSSSVYHLPAKEVVFFHSFAHSNDILHERLHIIDKIIRGEKIVVVASVQSLLTRQIARDKFEEFNIEIGVGDIYEPLELAKTLMKFGYEKVDKVEAKGMFSIRGGIIDYYPPQLEHPIRLEFFDDEIDSIRMFNEIEQVSIKKLQGSNILPAKEILLYNREKLVQNIQKEIEKRQISDELAYEMQIFIENINSYGYSETLELFIDYFEDEICSLIDYMPEDATLIMFNPNRIDETSENYQRGIDEKFIDYFERGKLLKREGKCTVPIFNFIKSTKVYRLFLMDYLQKGIINYSPSQIINMRTAEPEEYHGKLNLLASDLKRHLHKAYKVCIFVDGDKKVNSVYDALISENIFAEIKSSEYNENIVSGQCFIFNERLSKGVTFKSAKFIILSDYELFNVKKLSRRSSDKSKKIIKSYSDIEVGDLVVHENHGIGKYLGIEQLKIDDIRKDYFKIGYSGDDYLYIPIDQMEMIQKYIGGEVSSIKLHKLGGNEWKRSKRRAKKSIEDMTDELLELYAKRNAQKGYAFSPDTDWQRQFEGMFPYEETKDQVKCIEEIKRDMESVRPMDRLLCGDVGFGKTEVAIRATFKAVMDSKQVAILAPTTILAEQHYLTLKERFSKFPARVEVLSRFKTKSEQMKVIEDLRTGVVDVIVGTHRLLSKDVEFKDLGLLVVDEEQRFGVRHKERIKQLKTNLDVLTLSATPIPRTLHMSLVGVRDMSVIEDPPEDRYPIQTYVVEHDDYLIRDAIDREISRGGQVFYVYNMVKGIELTASKIKKLLPHIRVEYAHGQMNERKLEKVMSAFLNHEFDVLVCTTIIETGLDMSNVNTIIIDNADKMGVSQLYQLRGRVGRSNRIAYAYLSYAKNKILSDIAEKRLRAIKEFTELGSGFKISMRDLEIRGSGNILGAQQHGHIANIGYEYYSKLLEMTMRKIKGELVEEEIETEINYNINAYIPEDFIFNEEFKIEIYKKIAAIRNRDDAFKIEEEIEDRFGTLPQSVYNLIDISYVKSLAMKLNIIEISEKLGDIVFKFKTGDDISSELIERLIEIGGNRISFDVSGKPIIRLKFDKKKLSREQKLIQLKNFLEKIV